MATVANTEDQQLSPLERIDRTIFDRIVGQFVTEVDRKDDAKLNAFLEVLRMRTRQELDLMTAADQIRLSELEAVQYTAEEIANVKEDEDPLVQPLLTRHLKQRRADTPSVLPILSLMLCSRTLHQRLWVDTDETYWKRSLWACGVSRPVEFEEYSWKSLAREFARHQKSECKGGICLATGKEAMGEWFDMSMDGEVPDRLAKAVALLGEIKPVYPSLQHRALRCLKESQARKWSLPVINNLSAHWPECRVTGSQDLHFAPLLTPVPIYKVKVYVTFMRKLRPVLGYINDSFVVENHAGVTTRDLANAYDKYNETVLRNHCRLHFEELNILSCAPDNFDIHDVFNMKGGHATPKRIAWPLRVVSGGKMVVELCCPLFNYRDPVWGWGEEGYGPEDEDGSDDDNEDEYGEDDDYDDDYDEDDDYGDAFEEDYSDEDYGDDL